jgi:hypothetical protein
MKFSVSMFEVNTCKSNDMIWYWDVVSRSHLIDISSCSSMISCFFFLFSWGNAVWCPAGGR